MGGNKKITKRRNPLNWGIETTLHPICSFDVKPHSSKSSESFIPFVGCAPT